MVTKVRIRVTTVLLTTLPAAMLTACGPPVTAPAETVVVLVSASSHEPQPALTVRVRQLLRDAAEKGPATDGVGGVGSTAVLDTTDGQAATILALTPRRRDGHVEHGLQRGTLIEDNVTAVDAAVAATVARRPGVDQLEGIAQAVRGLDPGTLVVVGNGLSTEGGLDLRQVGWHADPADLVAQLRDRALLPDLTGWTVLFTGLGETSGAQPPLTAPARATLYAYWSAICASSGAASCEIDDTRLPPTAPRATVATPVVPVEGVVSATGPRGETTTTLSDAVLGFAANSAEIGPAAREVLEQTAERITADLADDPTTPITVRGWTANPPDASRSELLELSRSRAQAVADALVRYGVTQRVVVVGGGPAPDLDAMATGRFDETVAARMRRSEITYG